MTTYLFYQLESQDIYPLFLILETFQNLSKTIAVQVNKRKSYIVQVLENVAFPSQVKIVLLSFCAVA